MMTPILLLHGLIGSLSDQRILAAFGDAPVLAPDLLGYGETSGSAPTCWTLADQARHVAQWLDDHAIAGRVHVVGHSVGAAVGVLYAELDPVRVSSFTSMEGNFTLRDAFWSQRISLQDAADVAAELDGFRANLAEWLGRAGVKPDAWTLAVASDWLNNQPAETVRMQARAVVGATSQPAYLEAVRGLLDSGLPFHLLSGARSRPDWDVPAWVAAAATSDTVMADVGHLMMLEDPDAFARAVLQALAGDGSKAAMDLASA